LATERRVPAARPGLAAHYHRRPLPNPLRQRGVHLRKSGPDEHAGLAGQKERGFPAVQIHLHATLIVAALEKTITLRPKLNRFIVNRNF
jgi:hypothetical protein